MNEKTIERRLIKFWLAVLFAFVVPALPARAWNNVGHRVIAELAWRQLDSSERGAVSDLLKQQPHYQEFLAADIPSGVETNEWVFLKAAIWPDWVRVKRHGKSAEHITKYDLYPHALGLPFLKPGETNVALLKEFHIGKPTAAEVLSNSIVALNNPALSARERAVSLCWTLHLMGDLHQPLHCASMVSEKRRGWDGLGGNYVVIDPRGKPHEIDMHRLWDDMLGVESSYARFAAIADKINAAPEFKAAGMREYRGDRTPFSWVEEGLSITTNFVYAPERMQFAHVDDLDSGKISRSQIPVLKADYLREAETIAERRASLAGQRLADVLKRAF